MIRLLTFMGVHSFRVIVKMKLCLPLILVIFAASPVALAAKSYDGYKVLRVSVGDAATAHLLRDLGDTLGLDFWSQLRLHAHTDVMASPQNLDRLTYALDDRGIEYAVFVDDVQKLAERIKTADGSSDNSGRKMSW